LRTSTKGFFEYCIERADVTKTLFWTSVVQLAFRTRPASFGMFQCWLILRLCKLFVGIIECHSSLEFVSFFRSSMKRLHNPGECAIKKQLWCSTRGSFWNLKCRHIHELIVLNVEVTLDDFISVNSKLWPFCTFFIHWTHCIQRGITLRKQYLNGAGVHTDEKDMVCLAAFTPFPTIHCVRNRRMTLCGGIPTRETRSDRWHWTNSYMYTTTKLSRISSAFAIILTLISTLFDWYVCGLKLGDASQVEFLEHLRYTSVNIYYNTHVGKHPVF
jgi:hypothetical protein